MKTAARTIDVPKVNARGDKLKILGAVVIFYSVHVMDVFRGRQQAAKFLFHDKPMFSDISVLDSIRVIGGLHVGVPLVQIPELPVVASRATHITPHTCFRAVGSGVVLWVGCVAQGHRKRFSALFALLADSPLASVKKTGTRTVLVNSKTDRICFAVCAQ
jgi:hypothetical protein